MEEQKVSFADFYKILRGQIILAYDNAKEVALRNFDEMAKKLDEQYTLVEQQKKQGEQTVENANQQKQ